jgi:hypothetical protein
MDELETTIVTGDGDELSWVELARMVLTVMGVLVLAPAAFTILLAVGFFVLPVVLVVLPFILPGTVADGAAEHAHAREHDALPVEA